jgi:hypothetical protein
VSGFQEGFPAHADDGVPACQNNRAQVIQAYGLPHHSLPVGILECLLREIPHGAE